MVDLAKYVVSLEAEIGKYQRELRTANRTLSRFDKDQRRTLGKIDRGFDSLGNTVRRFSRLFTTLLAGAGAGAGIRGFQQISDEVALFDARLKSALGGSADPRLREELVSIATQTGQTTKSVVDLFQQISRLREVLRATDDDFVQFSENVFRLGIIGGSSAEEASNGLRQLRQALASTRVQAEEINSIIEQTPEIAAAIEKALDLVPGTLKSAVKEGRVLNNEVFRGILEQTDEIAEKFAEFPRTFAQFRSSVGTEFGLLLSAFGELSGITEGSKEALGLVERLVKGARLITESFLQAERQIRGMADIVIDRGAGFQTPLPTDEDIESVEAMFAALQQLRNEDNARRLEEERALMDQIAEVELNALKEINEEREQFAETFADNLIQASESGFDGVLKGWIRTLQQMIARAAATKLFETLFPQGLFTGGGTFSALGAAFGLSRDQGGSGRPGELYYSGVPEFFIPNTSGTFVPASNIGGVSINQTLNVSGASRAEFLAAAAALKEQTKAEVVDMLNRQGNR